MPKRQVPKPLLTADPDLLQIIGTVSDLLGLGEHIQRLLPIDRVRVQRRHRRISNLRDSFGKGLSEARTALRALATTIPADIPNEGSKQVGFALPASDLPVFSTSLDQLQGAIRTMTKAAYELEAVTNAMPDEVQRYYRISHAGEPVLESLKRALDRGPTEVRSLLDQIDRYLTRCSELYREGDRWREL
jgi:hypothetical protein